MAERRSRRRKREEDESEDEGDEVSEEQTEIAKHLRFNCETKQSNYQGRKVEYFKGSKAIDCLLDSKWASGKGGTEVLFTDRESVQDYLQTLLDLEMFKRVTRIKKKKKGEKEESRKKDSKNSPKPGGSKKDAKEAKESDGKKIKVKVKLEVHLMQEFLDGEEVFMWVFDPVHPRTIIYGVLVVIAAIVVCLFPLWPAQMREYTWYLSVAAAILLGALIVVALFRYVLFSFVWVITAGRHHFWLLPNLTEDCGFFESFQPLYTHADMKAKDGDDEKVQDKGETASDKDDKQQDNDGKTEHIEEIERDEDSNNETTEDRQEVADNHEDERDSEGSVEENQEEHLSTTHKEAKDTESWINLTQEDVAQAKKATGSESDAT